MRASTGANATQQSLTKGLRSDGRLRCARNITNKWTGAEYKHNYQRCAIQSGKPQWSRTLTVC